MLQCAHRLNLGAVAEAAVVGVTDELTGQAVNAFVSLKEGNEHNDQIKKDLVLQVRKSIGPFAAPKVGHLYPVPARIVTCRLI
jgi:acetyl-CoA synthetase